MLVACGWRLDIRLAISGVHALGREPLRGRHPSYHGRGFRADSPVVGESDGRLAMGGVFVPVMDRQAKNRPAHG